MKFVYTHLGLGDHLITNGLLRSLAQSLGSVMTFAKPHNCDSVRFMYRDVPVGVIPADDAKACEMLGSVPESDRIMVGHCHLNHGMRFDAEFYRIGGVPFERRWSAFHVMRDYEREQAVIRQVKASPPYAFVHQDAERGMVIGDGKVLMPRVQSATITSNLFDWMGVLWQAEEIHVIPSAFLFLVDSLPLGHKRLVLHSYTRPVPPNERPTLRHRWEILED